MGHMRDRILSRPVRLQDGRDHRLCISRREDGCIQIEAVGVLSAEDAKARFPTIVEDLDNPTDYHKPAWLEALKKGHR